MIWRIISPALSTAIDKHEQNHVRTNRWSQWRDRSASLYWRWSTWNNLSRPCYIDQCDLGLNCALECTYTCTGHKQIFSLESASIRRTCNGSTPETHRIFPEKLPYLCHLWRLVQNTKNHLWYNSSCLAYTFFTFNCANLPCIIRTRKSSCRWQIRAMPPQTSRSLSNSAASYPFSSRP